MKALCLWDRSQEVPASLSLSLSLTLTHSLSLLMLHKLRCVFISAFKNCLTYKRHWNAQSTGGLKHVSAGVFSFPLRWLAGAKTAVKLAMTDYLLLLHPSAERRGCYSEQ